MRLWIMSDLHQELTRYAWSPPRRPEFDVLVVAGDVREGAVARGLDWVASLAQDKPSVFVLGNHEFWGHTLEDVREEARERAGALGVTLLDGQGWVPLAGGHFAGCTLWTDQALNHPIGHRLYPREFGEGIDVRGPGIDRRAKGTDMLRRHREDLASLEAALGSDPLPAGPRIVVTHHAPHPLSIRLPWRNYPGVGAGSASDLGHLLACGGGDLWIHGHVHSSADYAMDGCMRVVCNPFGNHGTNEAFREDLVVDLAA